MICEKCGAKICGIEVNVFNREGVDNFEKVPFRECEVNAVEIETSCNWAGYYLTEEEQIEEIRCPHCHEFPFKSKEIQVYEVLKIVCFKSGQDSDRSKE